MSDVVVSDNADRQRFEARLDGELAGFLVYRREEGAMELVHTEVDESFEGKGIGSALARSALDRIRDEGLTVVPTCPFVKGWIAKHPDYADLVRS